MCSLTRLHNRNIWAHTMCRWHDTAVDKQTRCCSAGAFIPMGKTLVQCLLNKWTAMCLMRKRKLDNVRESLGGGERGAWGDQGGLHRGDNLWAETLIDLLLVFRRSLRLCQFFSNLFSLCYFNWSTSINLSSNPLILCYYWAHGESFYFFLNSVVFFNYKFPFDYCL